MYGIFYLILFCFIQFFFFWHPKMNSKWWIIKYLCEINSLHPIATVLVQSYSATSMQYAVKSLIICAAASVFMSLFTDVS